MHGPGTNLMKQFSYIRQMASTYKEGVDFD